MSFLELNKKYKNAFITAERINLPENIFCDDDYILEEQSINNDTIMQIYYYDE